MEKLDLETLKFVEQMFRFTNGNSCETLSYKRLCKLIDEVEKLNIKKNVLIKYCKNCKKDTEH